MVHVASVPGSCYFYYPRLVCVVGVRDEAKGTTNFAPVAWTTPLSSDPPLFGVCLSPKTYSHQLVLKTGEFTVNFLTEEQAALADDLGRLSGRETDKVRQLSLDLEPGETLSTPILAVAYVAAECALLERHHVGDQTLLVGEVHHIHTNPDAFDATGVLRIERVNPLLYLGSNRYATTRGDRVFPAGGAAGTVD
ncbi:MAG TPA: flavin reductase family protein [Thermoanaerobaculaceae bacterium]|nr:flavin reductase family protein [Thermoanaerobaculaceae bacterium]